MAAELTETFALLISKQMVKDLRKVQYEQHDKYFSMSTFVRLAIQEKLDKELKN